MNHLKTRNVWQRLFCASALLLLSAAAVYPQSASGVSGRWTWKEVARKNKPQTQFTIVVTRKGDVVSGTYSVDEFINGKWQGEDGNQTPFAGRVKGSTIEIEFDPSATVPGYQENVTYTAPTDGRQASTATLTLNGLTLIWRVVNPPGIEGVPAQVTLKRERKGRR